MRVRFLVSGLVSLAVAVLVATIPVLAEGGTTPACTIKGTSSGDLLIGTAGADMTVLARCELVHGGPGNDKIYGRDAVKDYIYGGRGFDYARDDDPEDALHSIESH